MQKLILYELLLFKYILIIWINFICYKNYFTKVIIIIIIFYCNYILLLLLLVKVQDEILTFFANLILL